MCEHILCICMYGCMALCAQGCTCMLSDENLGCLSSRAIQPHFVCLLLRHGLLWACSPPSKINCLASVTLAIPISTSPAWDHKYKLSCTAFDMDSGDCLNSDLYACATRILMAKPFAQPSPNLSEIDIKSVWEPRLSIQSVTNISASCLNWDTKPSAAWFFLLLEKIANCALLWGNRSQHHVFLLSGTEQ